MPKKANSININVKNEAASEHLGKVFAKHMLIGDIIVLEGGLGSGKTTLARAIIRYLLNDKNLEVPSPSFALVQPYMNKKYHILHVDLYRISDSSELEELGLFDDEKAILLVEWAQNAKQLIEQANWKIELFIGNNENERVINITNYDQQNRLKKLNDALEVLGG